MSLLATANGGGTLTIAAAGDIFADSTVNLTATGGITTAGDVTTTNDNVTYNSATTLTGPVAINTGTGLGTIAFNSTLDGGQDLTLTAGTGDITFTGAVGGTRLGNVTIASANNVTASSTFSAATLTQSAGAGTTTFNGAVDTNAAGGVSLTGNAQVLNANLTTTNGGPVTFTNAGLLTLNANVISDGAVTQNGAGSVTITGSRTISTTSDAVNFLRAVTLNGSGSTVAINTTSSGTGGDITFQSTLDGTTAAPNAEDLTLTAGTAGNILFTGAVGTTRLGDVTIASANNVTASSTFSAATLTQSAGTGTTTFNGATDTNAAGGISLTGTNLAVNNALTTTGTGPVTINESGTATFAIAGDINADGAVSITATGGISTAGDVTTTNDNVTFASATSLAGPVVINTGAGPGNIAFNSTLTGSQNLSLTAGTGDITFTGAVGATRLGNVTINSAGNVTASSSFSASTITQSAGAGTTTFNGATDTNATGGISLTGTNLAVNNTLTTTNTGPVTINESGTASFAAAGDITADGPVSITAAGGISTAGDVTTTNDNVTYNSATTLTGPVAINTGSGVGTIAFNSTLGGGQNLNLTAGTGDITFTGAVGGTRLGNITIANANNVTASSTFSAATITQSAGTGTTTFNGAVDTNAAGGVSLTGNAQVLNANLTTTTGGPVTFTNAGLLTLNANVISDGAVTQNGAGPVTITGSRTISTTSDNVDFLRAVTLNGSGSTVAINTATTGTGGNITFQSTLDATTAGANAEDLSLTAGTAGNITFTGAVGTTRLGDVTIASAKNVTASSTFSVATLTQSAGTGTTTFNGAVDTNAAGGVSLTGTNLVVNQPLTTTNAGPVTISESGTAGFPATGDINADGAVSITATGGIATAGDVTTTNDDITFASATVLTGNVALNAGSGNLSFSNTLNGGYALQANATGATTFGGAVGGVTALTSLTTNTGGTTAINGGAVTTSGAQTYNDNVSIGTNNATLTTTNSAVAFAGTTTLNKNLTVTTASGDVTFTGAVDGGNSLAVNSSGTTTFNAAVGSATPLASLTTDAPGLTTINANVTTSGAQTYNDPVRIDTSLTLATTNSAATFNNTLDSQSAEANNLTINTGTGAAVFNGAIGGNAGGAFGTLTINNTAAGVLLPAITATNLNVTTAGNIVHSGAGVLTLPGTTTLAAGSGNEIDLENANDFGTVVITSANDVELVDTNAINLGGATIAGGFTLTAGSHITESGPLNVAGTTTIAVTTANSDILLASQANDLGVNAPVLAGTVANIRDLGIRNINAGAKVPVIFPSTTSLAGLTSLRNLTLIFDNAPINLPGLTASGTLDINANGPITDSGPSVVSGLATLNANGFDIALDDPGNNFTSVNLAGAAITLHNVSSITLAGVQASSSFNFQSSGSLTISSPINSGSALALTSTGGGLTINAPVNSGTGSLTLSAASDIASSTSGTLTTLGGALKVTAGGSAQLAAVSTGGGTVQINAGTAVNLATLSGGTTDITAGTNLLATGATSTGNLKITTGGNVNLTSLSSGTAQITAGGSVVTTGTTNTGASSLKVGATGAIQMADISSSGGIQLTAGTDAQLAAIATNGGSVQITAGGSAHFISPLIVSGTFTATAPGGITFDKTVNGSGGVGDLTLNSAGVTRFSDAVGNSSGLHSLLTDATGSTVLAGGLVNVTGSYLFGDPVTVEANTTFVAPTGRFNDVLIGATDGGQALTFNVSGDAFFLGAIGTAGHALASFTTDAPGQTRLFGGAVWTTGPQLYNDAVRLGASTTMTASALTFNNTLDTDVSLASLGLGNTSLHAASTDSGLTANVSGATVFNQVVGGTGRLGDVTTDAAGSTEVHANFNSASLTVNDPISFQANTDLTIDTTGSQIYANDVTLDTNLTFNSALAAVFDTAASPPEGINFAQGLSAPGRVLTITAPTATISFGGNVGTTDTRLDSVALTGRYLVVGGDIKADHDIALSIGTGTTGENDFLQFTAPGLAQRNTTLDSLQGEIRLGSGAVTGTSEKTGAPVRSSIFKSNVGDLYLFARKITVQPYERLVVRNGSFVAIADGTAAEDGITVSNTAAADYLVLASSTSSNSVDTAGIKIRSRDPATFDPIGGNTTQTTDQGTDLVAGAVFFFNINYGGTKGGPFPTREAFAPALFANNATFDYKTNTGNIRSAYGPVAVTVLPDGAGATHNVYVADLVVTNRFRPRPGNLLYLDLSTAPGFTVDNFVSDREPFIDTDALGLTSTAVPLKPLVSLNAAPRSVLDTTVTPSVPIGEAETTAPEPNISAAVREQLQALGIYARSLTQTELISRERRMGLFITVPEREHPRDSDYEVAEARVENRAIRDVLSMATAIGLIGEDQHRLDETAAALASAYEAFTAESTSIEARDFRAWLEASKRPDAALVLKYVKTLAATLQRIELLGLTKQELASSKAQIYGSILRARLNADPEFFRELVEGAPATQTRVSDTNPAKPPAA
ncbi:MAG TPA: hypothetical protein VL200_14820 [Lacunisphaera sp.]|nr:hypothetical protein [Lacunisphaera sp.]